MVNDDPLVSFNGLDHLRARLLQEEMQSLRAKALEEARQLSEGPHSHVMAMSKVWMGVRCFFSFFSTDFPQFLVGHPHGKVTVTNLFPYSVSDRQKERNPETIGF